MKHATSALLHGPPGPTGKPNSSGGSTAVDWRLTGGLEDVEPLSKRLQNRNVLSSGLALSSTADSCGTNGAGLVECTWTLSNNDRVLEPEGTYVIASLPNTLGGKTGEKLLGEIAGETGSQEVG